MTGFDHLWRAAGGGTSDYNPARFAALVNQADKLTAPPTCPGCTRPSPAACWLAAVGATVIRERDRTKRRRSVPKSPPGQLALFPRDEVP